MLDKQFSNPPNKGTYLLTIGSIGYDTVTTPNGRSEGTLGGSATYFSIAASYFTQVSVVAVVGTDFALNDRAYFHQLGIDDSAIETAPGKTFQWAAEYAQDFSTRRTLSTQLNVFGSFHPTLTDKHKSPTHLFLGNMEPQLQLTVLEQVKPRPHIVAADTMNFWIEGHREALDQVVNQVDILFVDEGEARQYSRQFNLIKAAQYVMDRGPRMVVIKQGEHGVMMFSREGTFAAPAFLVETVIDPTGAGDSFAGGFMGYLTATGDLSEAGVRRAVIMGSVLGSYAVEGFGVHHLTSLTRTNLEGRFKVLADISHFKTLEDGEELPLR
jgi:sugar/nucleoside kinase (ribokinase family)